MARIAAPSADATPASSTSCKVRYAVVGAGHIAQVAVLPAFANAENSKLVALVSGDEVRRSELGERYHVEHCVSYEQYDRLLESGLVDAVYIALPNHLHCEYAVRAAEARVHVLCEKPMAVTEAECERMIDAAERNDVRLMVAYRLHFEAANLEAVELVQRGELGAPRLFESLFSQNVKPGDIRLSPISKGGGSVYDLGVYCINAARYLFRDEPVEVTALSASGSDERFAHCDEMTSAVLRFPGERLAQFTTSFGVEAISAYRVVGTEGTLEMHPAYEYAADLSYSVEARGASREHKFKKRDQFAPELIYFSECIATGKQPEPDGYEGLADVRLVRAIYDAAASRKAIRVEPVPKRRRPSLEQEIRRPGFEKPPEVRAAGPKV